MERLDRQVWIKAGLAALAENGLAAVRVELLAKRLKITKGSFYWHFADRQELLSAMIETWENNQTTEIIALVEAEGGPSHERLEHLSNVLTQLDMQLEVAMRGWAATDSDVRRVLQRIDLVRCAYLRSIIESAGVPSDAAQARARLVYYALIGELMSGSEDWLQTHLESMALNRPMILRWP